MNFRRTLFAALAAGLLFAQSPANLKNMDADAIDRTAKPCDDFYQFAIGKWNAEHPIPANQTRWGKRWAGADGNLEVLHGILESPETRGLGIGQFYAACMNVPAVDALGAKPAEPTLKRIAALTAAGQFPALFADLHREGVTVPFVFGPSEDSENPRQQVAGLMAGRLGLPDREYYLKPDAKSEATRERYRKHIETMLAAAGLDAKTAAAAIVSIETGLAREQLTRVERRDPYKVNNHMPAAKLAGLAPHFDWAAYYKALGVKFAGVVTVGDLKYMKEFDRQLQQTSLADWKLFLSYHVLRARGRDLSAPFRQEMFDFVDRYLAGQTEAPPRWKFCVQRTDAELGDVLGAAYVNKVFPPAAKARMQEMVKYLLAALGDSIQSLDWMTAATRSRALAKLAAFQPKVGYPDRWKSYAGLRIDPASHFGNVMRAERFNNEDDLRQIGKRVDPNRWGMTPPTSNAYYNPLQNEIVFPAGILVPPMFSLDADDAVNYGAIGVVIGHEISHGFDDQGSQYDAGGRLRNWWTPEDRKRFEDRAACVVDQFDNYFIEPGVRHNGKLVLGEAIGDLAGARIAYLAYKKSLAGKPAPPAGDGFSADQRFFLAWGQARGDQSRIEQQRLTVATDPHPVAKYRVIGPLSNMPEFRQAFGCQEGDAMVRPPGRSCRVW
jgi:putative endopeptidase